MHSTRAKQFSLSSSLDLDVTRSSPLTHADGNGTSRKLKYAALKAQRAGIIWKSRLKCGGPMTANERDPRVSVVHRCHSEGGDSILSAFSWEALRAKLQDN